LSGNKPLEAKSSFAIGPSKEDDTVILAKRVHLLILIIALALTGVSTLDAQENVDPGYPVISEFMAINRGAGEAGEAVLRDEDGDTADWIELYNPTSRVLRVGRWYLTDDPDNLTKWQFPPRLSLDPGAYLIVFASGKDRPDPTGPLHANFKLDGDGEYLALVASDGLTIAHEYGPGFPEQVPDLSYGLMTYSTPVLTQLNEKRFRVPTADDQGMLWMDPDFDDASWPLGAGEFSFAASDTGGITDIGTVSIPGAYAVHDGAYTVTAAGRGVFLDSFSYVYAALNGDGEMTARVHSLEDIDPGTMAGLMVRSSLENSAAYAALCLTPAEGSSFQYRTAAGARPRARRVDSGAAPFWLRIERKGTVINAYYALDGQDWVQQGSTSLEELGAAYIGLCVASHQEGTPCTAVFDNISGTVPLAEDLAVQMRTVNTSVWTRIRFYLEAGLTDILDSLLLNMKYDDGFVAYLNGQVVAQRNDPRSMTWNARAVSNRPLDLMESWESINLLPSLDLLREGENILAVHGLNDALGDPDFLLTPELIAGSSAKVPQYFATPTPGQANAAGVMGQVSDTQFSFDRGFYEAPFDLEIHTDSVGATIRYTTDGSAPSAVNGIDYTGPIAIHDTSCIRAVAVKPGWLSSNVDTQTYLFLDQVLRQPQKPAGFPTKWGPAGADYEMDPDIVNNPSYRSRLIEDMASRPIISLVMDLDDLFDPDTGIYANTNLNSPGGVAWERPGSVEYMDPQGPGFHLNCGVRVVGGWGAKPEYKKHSFRLLFKQAYGPSKLRYPLFGPDAADEFDTVTLRANFNDCWVSGGASSQYIRDEYCRRLQLALGQRTGHGIFVHLYVNGLYWGLYNPVERPDAAFAATYFGGSKEDWDVYNSGRTTGESATGSWSGLLGALQPGQVSFEDYQRIQGLDPDGTRNPAFTNWLDMDNYIDYMVMNFYTGNRDWPGHNWYAGLNRVNPGGFKCFSWDAEHVMGLGFSGGLNENATTVTGSIAEPYTELRSNSEFRLRFGDRAHRALFNAGPCYVDAEHPQWDPQHPERNRPGALYAELADWVEGGIVGESARWGDVTGGRAYTLMDWKQQRDWILDTYMSQRSAIFLEQLRKAGLYPDVSAPVFHIGRVPRHGGYARSMDNLVITAPTGEIYYTLDGTDPRVPMQVLNSGLIPIIRAQDPKWVLIPSGPVTKDWMSPGPFDDAGWTITQDRPGGIGYDLTGAYQDLIGLDIGDQMHQRNSSCYVRIPFDIDESSGFETIELRIRYDDGFIAYLNGREFQRVLFNGTAAWDSAAEAEHSAADWEVFLLRNPQRSLRQGENVLALQGLNASVHSSDFLLSIELSGEPIEGGAYPGDGGAVSPNAQLYTGPLRLPHSATLSARALEGQTWSALNQATWGIGQVKESLRITELMYHPADTELGTDPNTGYIELRNIGTEPINLNLVRFTDGIEFEFPALELAPRQHVLVVQDIEAFAALYGDQDAVLGQYRGRLSRAGERILLQDALGQSIHDFAYKDGWYDLTDGLGYSLTLRDPLQTDLQTWSDKSSWRPSSAVNGSPGWDDAGE
jgi:hypothetical protein